jgi:hypothetical protein
MSAMCAPFRAWINLMPPRPDDFHVIGGVVVTNPGIQATLTKRHPQGINPKILILDLSLMQQPGNWIQVVTCAQGRYDEILDWRENYSSVSIYHGDQLISNIDHIDVVQ